MRVDTGPCCDFTIWEFRVMGGKLSVVKHHEIEYVRPDEYAATLSLGDMVIEAGGNELSEMMNNLRDSLTDALAMQYAQVPR